MKCKILILLLGLSFLHPMIFGQKKLTFDDVYLRKAESLLNPLPDIREWFDDMHYLEVREEKILKVHARSGRRTLLFYPYHYGSLNRAGLKLSDLADHTRGYENCAFLKSGELFLFIERQDKLKKILTPKGDKQNPLFSPNGHYLAFTVSGNLFVYDIRKERIQVLTRDGNGVILNGYASWVYYEEILGRDSEYRAFWWSPDSSRIAFMRFDQKSVPLFTITGLDGDYGYQEMQYYPKPGYPNPRVKIGVVEVRENTLDWVDFNHECDGYLSFLEWGNQAQCVYFQWMNRNQNLLKIYRYDIGKKTRAVVYQERQKHWIEFLVPGDWQILLDSEIIIRSSKSGWYHLYHLNRNGKETQLTHGNLSVRTISWTDEKTGQVYFEASADASLDVHLYRIDFKGQQLKQLTIAGGTHQILSSTKGTYFLDTYSSVKIPPRLELIDKNANILRKIAHRLTPELDALKLAKVELFSITTDDGLHLPAVWYLPPDFNERHRYPVVLKVYGAPGSRIVRNVFDCRMRNYFLAKQGIIVMLVDHRGSGHFGKGYTDLMHRNLGTWELHDLIQTVKHLRRLPFIDAEKIGIWGSSYGGYVAALALCKATDFFSHGIADSSVIDWKLYDTVYTERYMDQPEQNPDGYRESSVLSHVSGYRGGLRITHGSMDDNVHLQHTFQFVKAVLETGKPIELMIYPGERHGYKFEMGIADNRAALNFWLKHFLGKEVL